MYKLLILDYIVNTIKPVDQIAEEFMTSTYGPIEFKVLDLNQDQLDDITLISNSNISEQYKFISNSDNQIKDTYSLIRLITKYDYFTVNYSYSINPNEYGNNFQVKLIYNY